MRWQEPYTHTHEQQMHEMFLLNAAAAADGKRRRRRRRKNSNLPLDFFYCGSRLVSSMVCMLIAQQKFRVN